MQAGPQELSDPLQACPCVASRPRVAKSVPKMASAAPAFEMPSSSQQPGEFFPGFDMIDAEVARVECGQPEYRPLAWDHHRDIHVAVPIPDAAREIERQPVSDQRQIVSVKLFQVAAPAKHASARELLRSNAGNVDVRVVRAGVATFPDDAASINGRERALSPAIQAQGAG